MSRPRLIVVAGPTASGKTALAVTLAERLGGEVISADSQQVYRHFDIGTAKPSPEELARAPHHLVSILDPHAQRMDAAQWASLADQAIAEIASRGRVPIVAGGTGLYVRALLRGVMPAPARDDAFRTALRARAAEVGWPALHAELAAIDPDAAQVIQPNDRVRIERALELWHTTGTRASALRRAHGFAAERHPFLGVWLDPDRAELFRRIDLRTQRMFDEGLLEETQRLLDAGLTDAPPMASIGYLQARALLAGRLPRSQALAEAAQETRRYAKRQRTWFKKEPGLQPLHALDAQAIEGMVARALEFLRG